MRRSLLFLLFTAAASTALLLLLLHTRNAQLLSVDNAKVQTALLQGLQLTDLCLSTEARYTRHPAMADRHAPFQDHPVALEHFPSGALINPFRPPNRKP